MADYIYNCMVTNPELLLCFAFKKLVLVGRNKLKLTKEVWMSGVGNGTSLMILMRFNSLNLLSQWFDS